MGEVSDTTSDVVAKMATAIVITILKYFIKWVVFRVCILLQIKYRINNYPNIIRDKYLYFINMRFVTFYVEIFCLI